MSCLLKASPPSMFPIYLLPSLPLRRSKSNVDSNSSSTDAATRPSSTESCPQAPSSGYFNGHASYLRCGRCAAELCLTSQIISKGFTGRHGRAYLVSASFVQGAAQAFKDVPLLPNTYIHKAVPRQLVTGAHTVADVSCAFCGNVLGWKYVAAEEESQRYKVGKYILETKKICTATSWEHKGLIKTSPAVLRARDAMIEKEVEFDSQDEDECEDLFAGAWSPSLALKRRQAKRFGRDSSW